ncbi:MAG: ribonuclease III [Candidatus Brocadiia bacterium]
MNQGLGQLQETLEYRFSDPSLLRRALLHASASEGTESNERLEFLGDAVVGLVVSEFLFRRFPDAPEGEMTVIKSAAVSRRALARVGRSLGLDDYLVVGDGLRGRRYPLSIVAGAYEAVVGAILLDGGMEPARRFVRRTLADEVEEARQARAAAGWKSLLQQLVQADGHDVPTYHIVSSEGPRHKPRFQAVVSVAGQRCGEGWGSTKKAAEQEAARDALQQRYPRWWEDEEDA